MNHNSGLRKNTLGLFSLVFFVIAAASPLTGVVGGLPVAIIAGNGGGIPVFYIFSCIILMLFSVGFVTMSRHIKNSGAFYTYISTGLGKNWGAPASVLALIAYISVQIAVVAMLGYFTQLFLEQHLNTDIPWWLLSMIFIIIVWMLSIKRVEIGGKILGVLMLAEAGIVLLTDICLLVKKTTPFSYQSFEPAVFLHGNLGIAFIFTIASFIGFESTAIYAEECRNPEKTVPRATLCALLLITGFFCFTSWALIQAYGFDQIVAIASKDPGNFVFNITRQYVGNLAVEIMSVLLITSLFAATLAFHNNISRYLFNISRDGLIWKELCKTHPDNGTPHNASHLHSVIMLMLLAGIGSTGFDPMLQIFAVGSAIATLCILILQLGVSAAVVLFFRRIRSNHHPFTILWAPVLSFICMAATIVLVINNLQTLSGSHSLLVSLIPWIILVCLVVSYFLSTRRTVKVRG
ncbi:MULTISPECIES: APC family permease [Tatumella]|uniref:APC family permease n=1 Tax=Tatumella punctata TaxID=399969 RepID=A0ABW1VRR9_9GAMM|nr:MULTISPECIES: APC family permease [unclassified Tatumella]MBS0857294.1 APC family permease [Tatumella sp. JGM16]MBS0878700.1 APC family permease [Tatumella sp. JGM82]MBS0891870.1 APC family permease [Tatumella sp. JGM94]MBS0903293.1 APC family permease [Tatumella sp. JGM100]MBS0914047.1 APC family permease [Tatumella sp. JGM91]